MSNPYSSPETIGASSVTPLNAHYSSAVHQVRVLGILTSVNGGLMIVMGLFFVAMAFFAGFFIVPQMQKTNAGMGNMPTWVLPTIYVVMGSGAFIGGVLQLWAGLRANQFHSRTFMIVALFAGCLGITTMYCALTAIPLAIYGLIVMFNPSVKYAFEMRKAGRTVPEVLGHFSYYAVQPQITR